MAGFSGMLNRHGLGVAGFFGRNGQDAPPTLAHSVNMTSKSTHSHLPTTTRSVILKRAAKDLDDIGGALAIENRPLPAVGDDEVLLRAIYVSLDPAHVMWVRMMAPYIPIGPGDAMTGQVVGEVMHSRADGIEPGDLVLVSAEMSEYSVVHKDGIGNGAGRGGILSVQKVDTAGGITPDLYLSLLSHTGMAASCGIKHVAKVQAGQTVLVSAAAGATGSVAAQLAKITGARVIGIAGGSEKCALLKDYYGLDGAIDHREDVAAQLAAIAPEGVDIFFDNVGGALLDIVLPQMKFRSRVIICGALSDYGNDDDKSYRFANISSLLQRNVQLIPFWLSDFEEHRTSYFAELRSLYSQGRLKVKPSHILDGIEAIPTGVRRQHQWHRFEVVI